MKKFHLFAAALLIPELAVATERPSILIITVDAMIAISIGAFGCKLPETSLHSRTALKEPPCSN